MQTPKPLNPSGVTAPTVFVSKINPKPDPKDTSISALKYESDLQAYKAIERLAVIDHNQWCFTTQRIMPMFDEMIATLNDLDNRLMELAPTGYVKSSTHLRVTNIIRRHNDTDAHWRMNWCAYTHLPEVEKENARLWAKKEYEAIRK